MFAVLTTGRNFQYGVQFLCFPESILLVVMIRHFSRKELFFSVFLVMKYCPISTSMYEILHPLQNLLTLFSRESISIRSSYRCNRRFWCDGMSLSKGTSALISLRTIDCPINTSGCLIDLEGIQILHTCLQPAPVKTELIGKNNYAKNSLNCWMIRSKMYRQFSVSFAFELTPGKRWCCCTENWTSAFCEFQQHLFLDVIPNSLWTILFHRIPLLFGTWTNKWPLSNTKLPCKYCRRLWHFLNIHLCCLFCHRRCHWTLT